MLTDHRSYIGRYDAALLEQCLIREGIHTPLLMYSELPSTNITAREYALQGAPTGSAVLAESQSAGRGRLGRSFFSPPKSGIYLTVVLRPPKEEAAILRLTTAVSVAVCLAIERICKIQTDIKWVNDIYRNGKKLCGILCEGVMSPEGELDAVVAGIGINVESQISGFPDELKETACALYEPEALDGMHAEPREGHEAPEGIREALIAAILHEVSDCMGTLTDGSYLSEYRKRSLLLGKEVVLSDKRTNDPNTAVTALAVDIDEFGGLVVKYPDGTLENLHTGEVTVRLR